MSKSTSVLLSMLLVTPLASAETIFKCVGKNGEDVYRNFPCPSEAESKVWVRTDDVQPSKIRSAPRASAPSAATPSPSAPSPTSDSLATPDGPRVGMTTQEVKAIWGEPTEVTREEVVQGRVETWSYGASRSVQFDHSGRVSVTQP